MWYTWRRLCGIFYFKYTKINRVDISMKQQLFIDNTSLIYLNVELKATARVIFFFTHRILNEFCFIWIQKWFANNERNWYAWEFKQTIFQKLHRCISETQASLQYLFNIHFWVLMCTIRVVFNKIVLQMTYDKVETSSNRENVLHFNMIWQYRASII